MSNVNDEKVELMTNADDAQNTKTIDIQKQITTAAVSLEKKLQGADWEKIPVGFSGRKSYDDQFDLYRRVRALSEIVPSADDKSTLSSTTESKKPDNIYKKSMVSEAGMGVSLYDLTPSVMDSAATDESHGFARCGSLSSLRGDRESTVVSCSVSYCNVARHGIVDREVISWQYAFVVEGTVSEFVFLRKGECLLPFELGLGRIMDELPDKPVDVRHVRRYTSLGAHDATGKQREERSFGSADEAKSHAQDTYVDGRLYHVREDWMGTKHHPVVLLCHAGKACLSSFAMDDWYRKNVLEHCTEIQGGVVNTHPIRIYPNSVDIKYTKSRNTWKYPVQLFVADTVCHAPADARKITDLGKVLSLDISFLEGTAVRALDKLLANDPIAYMEYCSLTVSIPLLYAGQLYGFNRRLPMTITSETAHMVRISIADYLGCRRSDFDGVYRGIKNVKHGLHKSPDGQGLVPNYSRDPISAEAESVQRLFTKAYHGGYNSCCKHGYYSHVTYDFDLRNAYPTAMCLVPDVEWGNPIYMTLRQERITLEHFCDLTTGEINPFTLLAARVSFEFPGDVRFPCIPCVFDDVPFFPRSNGSANDVYAAGPEIYLALMLGAYVYCEEGVILRTRHRADGALSTSLRAAVKRLVADRAQAKKDFGKGSLQEQILKLMVNSVYGKVAQDVIEKTRWDPLYGKMKDIGPSLITNPVSACMITSIVRALLLAAQNQIAGIGNDTYSVTTDGFIGDCSFDQLKQLDLYGMRPMIEEARLFLTDNQDPELWEVKHMQNDLLNYTTRGNVSLNTGAMPTNATAREAGYYSNQVFDMPGVCAHNGAKSGFEPDSYEDRLWLMKAVLSRTAGVESIYDVHTPFKELLSGKEFRQSAAIKALSMDYDMKRKPGRDSFERVYVELDGITYETVNFETEPFDDPDEFASYRQKAKNAQCLRTMDQWTVFFLKIDAPQTKTPRIMDSEWRILFDCIAGHRAGLWVIPKLDELTGAERNEWISKHSPRPFTASDWKNAGRSSRQKGILPRELIEDKLAELLD